MPQCGTTILDIGPNLLAFFLQGLILAGSVFALYRAQQNQTKALTAIVANGTGPPKLAVNTASPNPNLKDGTP